MKQSTQVPHDRMVIDPIAPAPVDDRQFLGDLAQRLATAFTEEEIVAITTERVGKHFGVDRCCFAECHAAEDRLVVGKNWLQGPMRDLAGEYRLSAFGGQDWWREFASGQLAVEDVRTNSLTRNNADAYETMQTRAYAVQPFKRQGAWTVVLGVSENRPRKWTPRESELLADVVARVWPMVERARADAQLRASEARYRLLFDQAVDGIFVCDANYQYTDVNDAACKMLGYTREQLLQKTVRDILIPENLPRQARELENLKSGRDSRGEWTFRRADGTTFIGEVVATPRPDGQYQAIVRNVEERNRVSEELSRVISQSDRYRRLYETILSTTPDLIYVFDLNHRFTYANAALLAMWGKTWDEAIGRNCLELGYEPWHAEMHSREIEQVIESKKPIRGEVPFNGTNGRRIYDYIFVPVIGINGEVEAIAGTTRDVTERKQAEAAVQRQNERFKLLWEAASVLLTTEDPEAMMCGLFEKIAPHLELDSYLNFMVTPEGDGLTLKSYIGMSKAMADSISHLKLGEALCGTSALQRKTIVLNNAQTSTDPRADVLRRLGANAYVCNPLIAGDRLIGTVSFSSTRRSEFKEDELDFLHTICRYVTYAYERLRLITELRQADQRKNLFLATLAHELRNPLAPLRTGIQLLHAHGNKPHVTVKTLATMERQMQQMVRLIDDLMDVARITQGKLQIRKERCSLQSIIESAIESAKPLLEAADVKLSARVPEEPILLEADPARVAQMFSNLLHNVAKYTGAGGQGELWVEVDSSRAAIHVRDNGVGIPRHMLNGIFEMFTQGPLGEKSHSGLGIGLALVRAMAEAHGGSVDAKSDGEGKGSEFIVTLPILGTQSEINTNADTPALKPGCCRILIVDDNRDAAEVLQLLLQMEGHDVHTAADGESGLALAESLRPDLVLLDIGMPGLTGDEVAKRIRAQDWGRAMKLVAVTGWGQEQDRARTRDAGFDHHLVKPVAAEALQPLIESARRRSDA